MLNVVVVALAIAGAVMVCVLACRWRIAVELRRATDSAQPTTCVDVRWLWFHFHSRRGAPPFNRGAETPAASQNDRPSPRRALAVFQAVLGTPGFPARLWRLIVEVTRRTWPDRIQARGRLGLGDPSDTGTVMGGVYAFQYSMPWPAYDVQIEPDFTGPRLEGEFRLEWSLRLVAILWPFLTFLAAPVSWRATRAALRARRV